MDFVENLLIVVAVLGMFIFMSIGFHEQGVIKGQKMALTGNVTIRQVTNEYDEVTWVVK